MEGYIKIHRRILESSVFASANGLKIWIWCLLKATYKPKHIKIKIGKGESIVSLETGQFLFGRFSAEEDLCIDGSTIYKWMKKFEAENMIIMESNSHYTRVTICNWDEYQQLDDEEVTAIQQPLNSQTTTNEQPCNTNKKEKNTKEYKKLLLSEINADNFPELNPEHIEIAKSFQGLFQSNLQEAGAATTIVDRAKGTAIDDVRLMLENDKYTITDLRDVYLFLQRDAFWKQNILSTSKLRERLPQLKLKMYNGTNRSNTKEATSWNELAEILHAGFAAR